MKRASEKVARDGKSSVGKTVVDRLAHPRLIKRVRLADLFTPRQQKGLPVGWKQRGWFAVQHIPLERLAVAATAVGQELPPLTSASVEELRGVVVKFKNLAGRFHPDDIRRRWFTDIAALLQQRANIEALANSNLKIELPTLHDSPDLLREKALVMRQQARKDAKDSYVREHLKKLASDAENRAIGIEQGAITIPKVKLTDFEKRNFVRLTDGGIRLTGSLPMSTSVRHAKGVSESKVQKALQFIREKGPLFGKEVAKHIKVEFSTFRTRYVPLLKSAHGVVNRPDKGYFVPTK